MAKQEVVWANEVVIPHTIRRWSGAWHKKHAAFVGKVGAVVGQAKNGHMLVKFHDHKNLIGIPQYCLTKIRKPTPKLYPWE